MGKRGPMPGPKHHRVMTGDIQIKAGVCAEPLSVAFDPPDAPEGFDEEHLAVWNKAISLLRFSSSLKKTDGAILEAYCSAVVRWRQAEAEIKKLQQKSNIQGLIAKTSSGYSINPLVKLANDERSQMVAFAVHLGMTPSARAKISVAQGEDLNKRVNAFMKIKKAKNEQLDGKSKELRKVIND